MSVYGNLCVRSSVIRLIVLLLFLRLSDWWPEGVGGGHVTAMAMEMATSKRGICEVQAAFHLKTVTPSWESNATSVDGCYSREVTAKRSQEVHVLHLREPAPGGPSPPQVVTVHVRPVTEHAVHGGPLIIVLHSDYSVNWRIVGRRLTNDTVHHIIVTKDSQVIEIKDLKVNIHRKNAAGRVKHLLEWVAKRQGALTSYTRIEGANHVYLKVGIIGDDAPARCNWKRPGHVSNVEGVYEEVVPISQRQGCIASGTVGNNDRIVHVVKIHEVHRDVDHFGGDVVDEPARVVVDLVSRNGRPVTRDVGLVLQAAAPVVWVVQSEGVWGRLDIVTEGKVETPRGSKSSLSSSSSPQRLSVRSEPLPSATKELLSYTVDWFGPSFAFSEVYRANRLQVIVDDHDGGVASDKGPRSAIDQRTPSSAVATKHVVKTGLGDGGADAEARADTRVLIKTSAPTGTNDIIRMPNVMLMDAMLVECLPQHMRVSFPRRTLEHLGFQPQDITLKDSHCSVATNDTHYVLSAPFVYCGTVTQQLEHGKIAYKNAVHFHFHVHKLSTKGMGGRSTSSDGGLPVDDEDNGEIGSGVGALPISSASYEPSSEPRALQFQCEYLSPTGSMHVQEEVQNERALTATREIFTMELFRDPSYIRSVSRDEFPFTVSDHDSLYVETGLGAGPTLRVVADDCWLSESSEPSVTEPRIQLIHNTCPVGSTVKFETSGDEANHRFSFQLTTEYADHFALYVHCKLAICTSNSSHAKLKICVDPHDFCVTESLRTYVERPRGTHHTTFTKGPFQVKRRSSASNTSPTASKIIPFQAAAPFRSQGKVALEVLGGVGVTGGIGSLSGLSETIDVRCTLPEQQAVIILGLSTEAVIGIAFASFIIGVGLSAALYCIYLKTDPYRRSPNRRATHTSGYDLSGHSGSSTPSSQSPMTA